MHQQKISTRGVQEDTTPTFVEARVAGEEAFMGELTSDFALNKLFELGVEVEPAQSVATEKASDCVFDILVAVDASTLVEFGLEILESLWDVVKIEYKVWGH